MTVRSQQRGARAGQRECAAEPAHLTMHMDAWNRAPSAVSAGDQVAPPSFEPRHLFRGIVDGECIVTGTPKIRSMPSYAMRARAYCATVGLGM